MMKRDKFLHKIKNAIDQTAPDADVILFGSRARVDSSKHSDWDILILLNGQNIPFELEKQFVDMLYEIEIETEQIISPLIYTKTEWSEKYSITPLFENIQKEGIKIQ